MWQSEGSCSQADRPSFTVCGHFHKHLIPVSDDPHVRSEARRSLSCLRSHSQKWQRREGNPAQLVFWAWFSSKVWRIPEHLVVSRQDPQPRSQDLSDSDRFTAFQALLAPRTWPRILLLSPAQTGRSVGQARGKCM